MLVLRLWCHEVGDGAGEVKCMQSGNFFAISLARGDKDLMGCSKAGLDLWWGGELEPGAMISETHARCIQLSLMTECSASTWN